MKHHFWWPILCLLLAAANADSDDDIPTGLTSHKVPCKKPKAPRPALPAEKTHEWRETVKYVAYDAVVADFNGDGWCDFAWAVPFPINSKMEAYYLEDILILGGAKGWRRPFKGQRSYAGGLDPAVWPYFRVDLTEVTFLQSQSGGAPFMLGLIGGSDFGKTWPVAGCRQYTSVHQWDDAVDGFKRVDGARREAVLNYYYSHVEKPCR